MKIGIIAAMEPEFNLIYEEIGAPSGETHLGSEFYEGIIGNNDVVIAKSGIAKVNAALVVAVLAEVYDCDLIINTGIAGGIAPLKHNDVVIGSKITYNDVDARIFNYKYGQVPGMPHYYMSSLDIIVRVKATLNKLGISYKYLPIYSGDKFITSLDMLGETDISEGGAVDMESAAIAQASTKATKDFLILRYISDVVGEDNQSEEYLKFEERMSNQSAKICLSLVKSL